MKTGRIFCMVLFTFAFGASSYGFPHHDISDAFNVVCVRPFVCLKEHAKKCYPNSSPVSHVFLATAGHFMGVLASVVVDRAFNDYSHKEFIANYLVQGVGWMVALGENLSRNNERNFYMAPKNKIFAIALVLATANSASFGRFARVFKHKNWLERLRSLLTQKALVKNLLTTVLRVGPQLAFIASLPIR